jgi:hypothetical protein
MNSNGYKILGYAVWRGGKWYLRRTYLRRLPSARVTGAIAAAVAALTLGGAIALLVRRAAG